MSKWNLNIKANFGGLAPLYYENTYPTFGRSNQAGSMQNCDILNPQYFTQGPGLADLTNGTQAGEVSTLIKHILESPTSSDTTFGIGGAELYKMSSSAVTSDGNYPHTIDKAVVTDELGESVVYLNDYLYYFYNHSGSAGDFGRLTVSTDTFDDDFGSAAAGTGASALENAPHPSILGDDGIIYFGNGRYVGYYDQANDTLSADELDFPVGYEVQDLVFAKNFIYILLNTTSLTGNNQPQGKVVVWDTVSSSFQEPIIELTGRGGSLIKLNGTIFVFYSDLSSTAFKLGYISGDTVQEVTSFQGSLPNFGQKTIYKNLIAFASGEYIYTWGAKTRELSASLSQIADGGHSTVGALNNSFGTPMVASNVTTSYRLAKFSGYETASNYKTIHFKASTSVIDRIKVHFEATASGARVDLTLRYNRGVSTLSLGNISHTNEAGLYHKSFYPKTELEDFSLEFDFTNGSTSNPLKIREIEIEGHRVFKH